MNTPRTPEEGEREPAQFVLPDIVEAHKNERIFGLFEIDPDSHKKSPIQLPNVGHQSADPAKGQLWPWADVAPHIGSKTYAISLSIPAFEHATGIVLMIRDLDEYKPDYDATVGQALLDVAESLGTFVAPSYSGEGKHVWMCSREECLKRGGWLRDIQQGKAIDNLRTYVVMSGKVLANGPVHEVVFTDEEREMIVAGQDRQTSAGPKDLILADGMMSPIYAANLQLDIEAELTALGFAQENGFKWQSPDSGTTAGGFVVPSRGGPFDIFITYNETGLDWMHQATSGRVADAAHLRMHRHRLAKPDAKKGYAIACLAGETTAINADGEILASSVNEYNDSVRNAAKQAALDQDAHALAADAGEDEEVLLVMPIVPVADKTQRPSPVKPVSENQLNALFPKELEAFPYHNPLEQLPGLLGHFAHYANTLSPVNTENGGLLVAVPLLCAIVGDTISTGGLQTRTNLNLMALDESGAGKTALLSAVNNICYEAELVHLLGKSYFVSGAGVRKMMHEAPGPQVCFMDEIGKMLASATEGKHGNPHAISALNEITKLYSASNSVDPGEAASTKEAQLLDYPHLSIFGVSTPDVFWDAFSSGSLSDGALARYMPAPLGDGRPQYVNQEESRDTTANLASHLKAFNVYCKTFNGTKAGPYRRPWGAGVEARRNTYIRTMEGAAKAALLHRVAGCAPVIRRIAENAAKLALLQSMCRNYLATEKDDVISDADLDFGFLFARWCAAHTLHELPNRGVGQGRRAKTLDKIVVCLQDDIASGKKTVLNNLGQVTAGRFKNNNNALKDIDKREWNEMLLELQEAGRIRLEGVAGSFTLSLVG